MYYALISSIVGIISRLTGLSIESSTTLFCLMIIAIAVFTFSKAISVVAKSVIVAVLLFFLYSMMGSMF